MDVRYNKQQLSLLYGIDKDAYTIEKGAVIRNKNLSDILVETGLTRQQIYTTSVKDIIFDVRKMLWETLVYVFIMNGDSVKDLAFVC